MNTTGEGGSQENALDPFPPSFENIHSQFDLDPFAEDAGSDSDATVTAEQMQALLKTLEEDDHIDFEEGTQPIYILGLNSQLNNDGSQPVEPRRVPRPRPRQRKKRGRPFKKSRTSAQSSKTENTQVTESQEAEHVSQRIGGLSLAEGPSRTPRSTKRLQPHLFSVEIPLPKRPIRISSKSPVILDILDELVNQIIAQKSSFPPSRPAGLLRKLSAIERAFSCLRENRDKLASHRETALAWDRRLDDLWDMFLRIREEVDRCLCVTETAKELNSSYGVEYSQALQMASQGARVDENDMLSQSSNWPVPQKPPTKKRKANSAGSKTIQRTAAPFLPTAQPMDTVPSQCAETQYPPGPEEHSLDILAASQPTVIPETQSTLPQSPQTFADSEMMPPEPSQLLDSSQFFEASQDPGESTNQGSPTSQRRENVLPNTSPGFQAAFPEAGTSTHSVVSPVFPVSQNNEPAIYQNVHKIRGIQNSGTSAGEMSTNAGTQQNLAPETFLGFQAGVPEAGTSTRFGISPVSSDFPLSQNSTPTIRAIVPGTCGIQNPGARAGEMSTNSGTPGEEPSGTQNRREFHAEPSQRLEEIQQHNESVLAPMSEEFSLLPYVQQGIILPDTKVAIQLKKTCYYVKVRADGRIAYRKETFRNFATFANANHYRKSQNKNVKVSLNTIPLEDILKIPANSTQEFQGSSSIPGNLDSQDPTAWKNVPEPVENLLAHPGLTSQGSSTNFQNPGQCAIAPESQQQPGEPSFNAALPVQQHASPDSVHGTESQKRTSSFPGQPFYTPAHTRTPHGPNYMFQANAPYPSEASGTIRHVPGAEVPVYPGHLPQASTTMYNPGGNVPGPVWPTQQSAPTFPGHLPHAPITAHTPGENVPGSSQPTQQSAPTFPACPGRLPHASATALNPGENVPGPVRPTQRFAPVFPAAPSERHLFQDSVPGRHSQCPSQQNRSEQLSANSCALPESVPRNSMNSRPSPTGSSNNPGSSRAKNSTNQIRFISCNDIIVKEVRIPAANEFIRNCPVADYLSNPVGPIPRQLLEDLDWK